MSGESAEGVAPRPVESAVIVPVLQADATPVKETPPAAAE